MSRRTGSTSPDEPDAVCQCATLQNASLIEHRGQCLIVCEAPIEKKHVICRPCALGNHTGKPCRQVVPDYPPNLVHTCVECGFDTALHELDSAGRPMREGVA